MKIYPQLSHPFFHKTSHTISSLDLLVLTSSGGKHENVPLATTRIALERHFEDMIKKCSDKVTELCKLEKQTWQTVDELNEKCEAMMKQVDTTAEKQVQCSCILF